MYNRTPELDPVIRDGNQARPDCIYFALTSSMGWCVPGFNPWSWTLHIIVHPESGTYNDQITSEEYQVKYRPVGSVDLPAEGLDELIRLSKDERFLDITPGKVYRCDICDGGSESVEYYINGRHRELWCYCQSPLFDGGIDLKTRRRGLEYVTFETGLGIFGPLAKPVVEAFYALQYEKEKDEWRARGFVEAQTWKFAKTMPRIPHFYCLKGLCPDPAEFEWFVDYLQKNSVPGEFYGRTCHYFFLDNWKYWIMDADLSECNLINREEQTNK